MASLADRQSSSGDYHRDMANHHANATPSEETPLLSPRDSEPGDNTLGPHLGANGSANGSAQRLDDSEPKLKVGALRATSIAFSLWLLIFLQGKHRRLTAAPMDVLLT